MKQQLHLLGAGHSGRAVRLRMLSPTEVQRVRDLVGADVTEETKIIQFEDRLMREGVEQAVVSYTEPVTTKGLPEAKWIDAKAEVVHDAFEKLFTAKDAAVLVAWYRQQHTVSQKEVDAILGGAIGVVD